MKPGFVIFVIDTAFVDLWESRPGVALMTSVWQNKPTVATMTSAVSVLMWKDALLKYRKQVDFVQYLLKQEISLTTTDYFSLYKSLPDFNCLGGEIGYFPCSTYEHLTDEMEQVEEEHYFRAGPTIRENVSESQIFLKIRWQGEWGWRRKIGKEDRCSVGAKRRWKTLKLSG